jgi:hypothetical protein
MAGLRKGNRPVAYLASANGSVRESRHHTFSAAKKAARAYAKEAVRYGDGDGTYYVEGLDQQGVRVSGESYQTNPAGRRSQSVRLKNFTGTISKKGGQIVVRGKGR